MINSVDNDKIINYNTKGNNAVESTVIRQARQQYIVAEGADFMAEYKIKSKSSINGFTVTSYTKDLTEEEQLKIDNELVNKAVEIIINSKVHTKKD